MLVRGKITAIAAGVLGIMLVLIAIAYAQFSIFQINGGVASPSGFGGGPNMRSQFIFGAPPGVTPDQYYVPGTGNPAVSTADYYYVNGAGFIRPVDLASTSCGAFGAAAAAVNGRYAWFMGPNHDGNGITGDQDGLDIYVGFSNDPGVLPSSVTPIFRGGSPGSTSFNVGTIPDANFTGTITSNVLTVSASPVPEGRITLGDLLIGAGVTGGAKIAATNTGTGTGGAGTYDLSPGSANVGSVTMQTQQTPFSAAYFPTSSLCNPDDTSFPFYLYLQGGTGGGNTYETTLLRSNDMLNWVMFSVSHANYNGNNIARVPLIARTGVNTWTSLVFGFQQELTSNQTGYSIWTSTDGQFFNYVGPYVNQCIPVYNPGGGFGPNYCPDGGSDFQMPGPLNDGLTFTVGGQAFMARSEAANIVGQSNTGGMYVARVPVDAGFNVLASPPYVRISNQYSGIFPGPTYAAGAANYVEDGIAHYYVTTGNYECLTAGSNCDSAVQLKYGAVLATTSSSTAASSSNTAVLHLTSSAGLFDGMSLSTRTSGSGLVFGTIIVPGGISGNNVTIEGKSAISGMLFPPIPTTTVGAGESILFYSGGLRQEFVDYYTEIADASAAAGAAPFGVTASAAAGVATITCYDALPTNTYRLYRGFSPTVQSTLVGNFTGCGAITDQPFLQTPQVVYYKLVYVNSGTEKKSRIVSTYVSSSTAFVNSHITRVLAAGADPATIDRAWLDTVDAWLTTNNLKKNLQTWMSPSFGVKQDVNGIVSKAFDIGTTRLPRGGDYTPHDTVTHTVTYNPTGMGSTTPALMNTDSQSFGYFGNGRVNNIRRKVQITACASYSRSSGGADATPIVFGAPDLDPPYMFLKHVAGTPGSVAFLLTDDTGGAGKTATASISSATGNHVICGTFDTLSCATATCTSTALTAWADGSGGTPVSGLHANVDQTLATTLSGSVAANFANITFLGSGSDAVKNSLSAVNAGPVAPYNYITESSQAAFNTSDLIVFDAALNSTQIASLNTLIANRIAPPAAITYNFTAMPSGASGTCNGSADDSPAFINFNALATAWDAANPGVSGNIVLNIPNSKCISTATTVSPVKGIVNHTVRVVGAGTSAELSDNGTGQGFFLGGGAQFNDNLHQANTATVLKGSTSVALTACPGAGCATAVAIFSVGAPARMEGIDTQGGGAYPTNPAFFDYLTVACASTTLTCSGGNISFTSALTHDYKSTWPNYFAGSGVAVYSGGPATLYALDPSWALTAEYNTLIIDQLSNQTISNGKSITFKNVTFTGSACGIATQNGYYAVINATMTSCAMEVDKDVGTFVAQNVNITSFNMQSSSIKQMIFSEINSTGHINGSGQNTIIANSTVPSWSPGAYAFGCSYGQLYILGNSLPSISPGGAQSSGVGVSGVGSWSGGVYTIANTDIPAIQGGNPTLSWAVPGANVFLKGTGEGQVFQILDIAPSGSNTVVTTSFAGGLPATPPGTNINASCHYAPQLTAIGNYGSAAALDLNQTPAGSPMGSYSRIIVAATNGSYASATVPPTPPTVTGNPSTPYTIPAWGLMVGVNITVGTAYTGATGTMHFDLNSPFFSVLGSTTRGQWNTFEINAKVASTTPRFLGPTSTANPQSGDTLASPSGGSNTWFVSSQNQPVYSSIPGDFGSTSTTIEIKTNQGVVNSAQQ